MCLHRLQQQVTIPVCLSSTDKTKHTNELHHLVVTGRITPQDIIVLYLVLRMDERDKTITLITYKYLITTAFLSTEMVLQ